MMGRKDGISKRVKENGRGAGNEEKDLQGFGVDLELGFGSFEIAIVNGIHIVIRALWKKGEEMNDH